MVAYGSHSKLESEHSRCEIICTPARVVDSVHLMVQSVDTCLILWYAALRFLDLQIQIGQFSNVAIVKVNFLQQLSIPRV